MVVRTMWPGATAEEVAARSPNASRRSCRNCRSRFHPQLFAAGESQVFFDRQGFACAPRGARCLVPGAQEDRRHPPHPAEGTVGPFFNDEFGDTFGNIYALTGDGFDYATC
jgi:multidrug efflux pump